jgi:hypothetical protein
VDDCIDLVADICWDLYFNALFDERLQQGNVLTAPLRFELITSAIVVVFEVVCFSFENCIEKSEPLRLDHVKPEAEIPKHRPATHRISYFDKLHIPGQHLIDIEQYLRVELFIGQPTGVVLVLFECLAQPHQPSQQPGTV